MPKQPSMREKVGEGMDRLRAWIDGPGRPLRIGFAVMSGLSCFVAIGASSLWRHRAVWEVKNLSRRRARFRGQVIGILGDGTLQVVSQPVLRRALVAPFADADSISPDLVMDVRVCGIDLSQRESRLWLKKRLQSGIRSVRFDALAWQPPESSTHQTGGGTLPCATTPMSTSNSTSSIGVDEDVVEGLGRPVLVCRVSRRPAVLWPAMSDVGMEAVGNGVARVRDAESLIRDVSEARTRSGMSEQEELKTQHSAQRTLPALSAYLVTRGAGRGQTQEASEGSSVRRKPRQIFEGLRYAWTRLRSGVGDDDDTGTAERRSVAQAEALASVAVVGIPNAAPLVLQYQLLAECAVQWEREAACKRAGWTGVAGRAVASVSKRMRK